MLVSGRMTNDFIACSSTHLLSHFVLITVLYRVEKLAIRGGGGQHSCIWSSLIVVCYVISTYSTETVRVWGNPVIVTAPSSRGIGKSLKNRYPLSRQVSASPPFPSPLPQPAGGEDGIRSEHSVQSCISMGWGAGGSLSR